MKNSLIFAMVMCMLITSNSVWADITDGLIGYWPLDEGSGTTTADMAPAGHGNDGALVNGPVWTSGKFGGALNFDGVDDYVLCAERIGNGPGTYPAVLMPETFTISCWTKLNNFAYFSSFVGNGMDTGDDECGFFLYNWGWVGENEQDFGLAIRTESGMNYVETPNIYQTNTWYHLAAIYDGTEVNIYVDGSLAAGPENVGGPIRWISAASGNHPERFAIGVWLDPGYDLWIDGIIDEVGYWDRTLTEAEIKKLAGRSKASEPSPADGVIYPDTWVNLSWVPGAYAVSHDVYFGENFNDVSDGIIDTFQGNQAATFFVAGFPGFPVPDGLVPGTTYYWRIDEVNDTEPNSPWKGPIWSFSIPPKTAYFPDPADEAEGVSVDVQLSWTGGFGTKLHYVYFGDNFDDVNNATGALPLGDATYDPGPHELAKTYYWRVDEFDVVETHKGDVWSFTTEGAVGSPSPAKGVVDVTQTPTLTWAPGFGASYEVYFGADPTSLELKGSGNLGSESYEPGQLEWNTTYYWRVNEANNVNPDSPWTGPLWSFTTANFLIIDDMESYNDLNEDDPASNRIYNAWLDGYDDPTNGSQSGHLDPPFYEETIVHSGDKSMPIYYDNSVGKSEATLTLTSNRDWTMNGVDTLTIWYRGNRDNAAETMYVTLNGSATVDNDNPDAALAPSWTEWNTPLQAFADQGINLSNVTSITLGLRSVTGGTGMMYFDDIRLCPTAP